jgi:glucose/arabinose dehydrogenase
MEKMMKTFRWVAASAAVLLPFGAVLVADNAKIAVLITGQQAFIGSPDLKPGTFRKITVADLPEPGQARPFLGKILPRQEGNIPLAPAGFKVELYAHEKLEAPRQIRRAPNGDLFVAETNSGEIKVVRDNNGRPEISVFASGLQQPFGVNFYPLGTNPQYVYVGNTGSLVRFAYKNGDLKASGAPETLISDLPPKGNHFTRDVVFSKDGRRMFISVGSADNVSDSQVVQDRRANILEYTPDGKFVQIYASGIRNPVGLGIQPTTGEVWTSVNERDGLGDNLVPDYVTSVKEGGFYGWPWFYIGQHDDTRARMARPADKTKDKVVVPDVLLTPHSASLGLTFYDGTQFPAEYRGDLFAAEHGSWNRSVRAGLEVIRVPLTKGKSNGTYEDFLTGFFADGGNSWGRPVGVAVGKDGALYVTDDGSASIWKVSYVGR